MAKVVAEACGGNPLLAEELAWYLEEHGPQSEERVKNLAAGTPSPTPEGITALIAARLDALPAEERALLLDAAVVGQVFWPGAVAAAGFGHAAGLEPLLDSLVNREFVVPRAASTLASEAEYAFRHALTRDVAYEQLTRDRRARKHARVAGWIETVAPPGGLADLLTYHYEAALDLAVATSDDELASALMPSTASALEAAGDQAFALDVATAQRRYSRAAALVDAHEAGRGRLLGKWADALWESGREREALDRQDEAIAALEAEGREEEVALARTARSLRRFEVDSGEWPRLPGIADDLLRDGSESAGLIPLLEYWAYVSLLPRRQSGRHGGRDQSHRGRGSARPTRVREGAPPEGRREVRRRRPGGVRRPAYRAGRGPPPRR